MMMIMMMMRKIDVTDFVTVILMMMIRITEPIGVFTVYLNANFISRLSVIVQVNVVLNRAVVDSD